MSDLEQARDHASAMAKAQHKPDCLQREHPWTKAQPTCGQDHCVTDADRALWAQLADEYDQHLHRHQEATLL